MPFGTSYSNNNLYLADRKRRMEYGLPIVRGGGIKPPIGYKRDPNNPRMLILDLPMTEFFILVQHYLKESSYQAVSDWMKKTGKFTWGPKQLHKFLKGRIFTKVLLLPLHERERLYLESLESTFSSYKKAGESAVQAKGTATEGPQKGGV